MMIFHEGELAMQRSAGAAAAAEAYGRRGIRAEMPDQHRAFFRALPLMVFGGCDASGQPWATVRVGRPGFVSSPDPTSLVIEGGSLPGDPLDGHWREGVPIAGLGIQLETRRRNRVNGVIERIDPHEREEPDEHKGATIRLRVRQSFGNCPKYIQRRTPVFRPPGENAVHAEAVISHALNDDDIALIGRADTFFIATVNLQMDAGMAGGADVSHKGGLPGFVRVDDARTLTAPDFVGNNFFNTLGNLLIDPRAGLLFIDFETGDLLYLSARARIILDGPEVGAFAQAQRLVRFELVEVRRSRAVLPFTWSDVTYANELVREASTAIA